MELEQVVFVIGSKADIPSQGNLLDATALDFASGFVIAAEKSWGSNHG